MNRIALLLRIGWVLFNLLILMLPVQAQECRVQEELQSIWEHHLARPAETDELVEEATALWSCDLRADRRMWLAVRLFGGLERQNKHAEILRFAQELPEESWQANTEEAVYAHLSIAWAHHELGQPVLNLIALEKAATLAENVDGPIKARLFYNIAVGFKNAERQAAGLILLEEARKWHPDAEMAMLIEGKITHTYGALVKTGEFPPDSSLARTNAQQRVIAFFLESGQLSNVGSSLADLAFIYEVQGDFLASDEAWDSARRYVDDGTDLRQQIFVRVAHAEALLRREEAYHEAQEDVDEAILIAEESGIRAFDSRLTRVKIEVELRLGNILEASTKLEHALSELTISLAQATDRARMYELVQAVSVAQRDRERTLWGFGLFGALGIGGIVGAVATRRRKRFSFARELSGDGVFLTPHSSTSTVRLSRVDAHTLEVVGVDSVPVSMWPPDINPSLTRAVPDGEDTVFIQLMPDAPGAGRRYLIQTPSGATLVRMPEVMGVEVGSIGPIN